MTDTPRSLLTSASHEGTGKTSHGRASRAWDTLKTAGQAGENDIGLFDTALALGLAVHPGRACGAHRRHMDRLVSDVEAYAGPHPAAAPVSLQVEALREVICRRFGYGGSEDVFEDIGAADLFQVIDNRRGLPVALGILYLECAARLGWHFVGIDFPGRFLIRAGSEGDQLMLDVFEGVVPLEAHQLRAMLKAMAGFGAELSPTHFREMSRIDVLLRLQDNIRSRQMQRGALDDALVTLETMVHLKPKLGPLHREIALIHTRHDRLRDAITALERYLALGASGREAYEASLLLQELRARTT